MVCNRVAGVLAIALTWAVTACPVAAQYKSDPVPNNNQNNFVAPDVEAFKKAYENAGEPPIMIVTGRNSDLLSFGDFVGKALLTDIGNSPDAMAMERSVQEVLLQNADLDLVDPSAAAIAELRNDKVLEGQNEARILELVRNKMRCDFILSIQLVDSADVKARGGLYRVTVDGMDLVRGRKVTTFAFDWMRGNDAATVKLYAQQVARKFIEQYGAAKSTDVTTYTLLAMNLPEARDLIAFRRALEDVRGVDSVRDRGVKRGTTASNNRGRVETIAEFRVKYAGSQLELSEAVLDAAKKALDREVTLTDSEAGQVMVRFGRAGGASVTADGDCDKDELRDVLTDYLVDFSGDDPLAKCLQGKFLDVYRKEGSPKIGVVLNRRIDEDESKDLDDNRPLGGHTSPSSAAQAQAQAATQNAAPGQPAAAGPNTGTSVNVVVGSPNGGGNDPANMAKVLLDADKEWRQEQDERLKERKKQQFTTRLVEDGISQRFLKMGLTTVDPTFVKNRILKKAANAGGMFNEQELEQLLQQEAKEAGLDVVIIGYSYITRAGSTLAVAGAQGGRGSVGVNEKPTLGFTVRAISLANGVILGSISYASAQVYDDQQLQKLVDDAADYIAGHICSQMWDVWVPPRVMTVTVFNARTPKDVLAVMDGLKQNVPGIQQMDFMKHEAGVEGGMGVFNLRYEGDYDDFLRKISALGDKVPFDLDPRGITRADINLRIRDSN